MKSKTVQTAEPDYLYGGCSDIGNHRETNQDAYCIKRKTTLQHTVVMAAVCDGVGGLSEGEYASRSMIEALTFWFDSRLSLLLKENENQDILDIMAEELQLIIGEQNQSIYEYGAKKKIKLGTTLTLILFVDEEYFTIQIGDSRAYLLKDGLVQLTQDQSLVAREVKQGILSKEEAKKDKRRNIILQCIGGARGIYPGFTSGRVQPNAVYCICSDGFYNQWEEKELEEFFAGSSLKCQEDIELVLKDAIKTVKGKGERDNITILLVRT